MPQASHDSLWILAGLGAAWCLAFASVLWMAFLRHPSPRFDFHWGSLGRGLGGWEISWSLVVAVMAVLLTIGTVTAAVELISPSNPQNPDTTKKESAGAGKAEAGAKGDGSGPGGEGNSAASKQGESESNGTAAAQERGGKGTVNPGVTESKLPAPVAVGKKAN